jgi:hypothetical protein
LDSEEFKESSQKGRTRIVSVKVEEISIEELKTLISNCVRESIEDAMEDLVALNSKPYCDSVEEARKDIREGRFKSMEEVFGE